MSVKRISFGCLVACVAVGCGDATPSGDGDAGAGDAGVSGRDASALPPVPAGRVRVVEGPAPLRPMQGALVRVESETGRSREATTDAQGTVALSLPDGEGRWSLTAAKRGYAAVSIVGLGGLPDGDLRLDPVVDFGLSGVALRGEVTGADPRATVIVDAFNIDTASLMPGATRFDTLYYNELPSLPLALTAIEVVDGRATRIARAPSQPRSGMPIEGVSLRLPDAASGFRAVRVPVSVPGASSVTTEGLRGFAPSSVWQTDVGYERTSVAVGVARSTFTGPESSVEFDVTDGPFKPDFAIIRVDARGVRTNLIVHAFDGSESFTIPTITSLGASGVSLGELTVSSDARQVDAVALHVGEDADHAPRWRCFVLPSVAQTGARLPTLPGGLTLADLGLTTPTISYGAMAIWMYAGRPWSTPNSNGAVLGYRVTVTSNYRRVSAAWR